MEELYRLTSNPRRHTYTKNNCLKARYKKVMLRTLAREDGSITNPGTETIEYQLGPHFRNSSPIVKTEYSKRTISKRAVDKPGMQLDHCRKYRSSIWQLQKHGTANISPIVLKHLPRKFITELVFLYRTLVLLHFTPTKWKECKL